MHFVDYSFSDLINQPILCNCGRIHQTNLKHVLIETDILQELPSILTHFNYKKPFLIADHNTMNACGNLIREILTIAEIPHILFELPMNEILPDETRVGSILMGFDRSCDSIIAIGSGSINDLARFTSYQLGLPYSVIGTAPSMDGFVSNVAAMTTNQMKTTYPAHVPDFVLSDLNILCNAPYDLITAGFGDIMGKFTCIADWQLSHIVTEEYYCEEIANLIIKARDYTLASKSGLSDREPNAITQSMNALLLSGIGMSFAKNSRPASGSEHHLSHFWEMRYLFEGRKPIFHGTKVAIGTIVSLKLYELLGAYLQKALPTATYSYQESDWILKMKEVFLNAASEVIRLEQMTHKNSKESWEIRISKIQSNQEEIASIIASLPKADTMVEILKSIHAPYRPSDIGLDRQLVYDAICYAKEVRNRYTILQLLWDIGVLEQFARETTDYLFSLT